MKKLLFLLAITSLISGSINAQAFAKGDILIDVGIGLGIYGTEVETSINGVIQKESDGTASVIVPIKAQYGISNKFSVGLMVQSASYIIDSADIKNEEASGTAFRVIGSYYFLNKDRLKLYAEMGFGAASFNQESEDINANKIEAEWAGGNFSVGLGMKFYFSKHIGFFANTNYNNYAFDLDKISGNGTSFSFSKGDWTADFSGAEIAVGLAFKF